MIPDDSLDKTSMNESVSGATSYTQLDDSIKKELKAFKANADFKKIFKASKEGGMLKDDDAMIKADTGQGKYIQMLKTMYPQKTDDNQDKLRGLLAYYVDVSKQHIHIRND